MPGGHRGVRSPSPVVRAILTLVIRSAGLSDFPSIQRLYARLNPNDPPVTDLGILREIIERSGLDLLLLENNGPVIATIRGTSMTCKRISVPCKMIV